MMAEGAEQADEEGNSSNKDCWRTTSVMPSIIQLSLCYQGVPGRGSESSSPILHKGCPVVATLGVDHRGFYVCYYHIWGMGKDERDKRRKRGTMVHWPPCQNHFARCLLLQRRMTLLILLPLLPKGQTRRPGHLAIAAEGPSNCHCISLCPLSPPPRLHGTASQSHAQEEQALGEGLPEEPSSWTG